MRPNFTPLTIVLAILLFPVTGMTQTVSQAWAARFITVPMLQSPPAGMVTDAAGNVYILGTKNAFNPNADLVTVKYNSAGLQQWVMIYNSPYNNEDEAIAIAIDGVGNVVVTGNSKIVSGIGSTTAISTVKYSPAGVQLWATTTQNGADNIATALTIDAAGNVYIAGDEINTPFAYDFLTVKLNSAGVQQWAATYNGTANSLDMANAITVDPAGNVYVTGQSIGQIRKTIGRGGQTAVINTGFDFVTIKYNSAGTTLWTARYNGGANTADIPVALALDASANVYVTGQTGNFAFTIAYTTDGAQIWTRQNSGLMKNTAITTDPSGNIVIAGYYYSAIDLNAFYEVMKFTAAGTPIWWSPSYPGNAIPPVALSVALAVDQQGACYMAVPLGTTPSPSTASYNYATIKVAPDGTQAWVATYNGPFNGTDLPTAIAVSKQVSGPIVSLPSIYVLGTSDNTGSGFNYTTVKYTQQTIQTSASLTGDNLSQTANTLSSPLTARLSNYPNPFNGTTTISYTLPRDGHVSLEVYDQSGKFIANIVEENESAGIHTLSFAAGRLAPGIYQYRIIAKSPQGTFSETKQMLLGK
jgi:Beta-propeller repeat